MGSISHDQTIRIWDISYLKGMKNTMGGVDCESDDEASDDSKASEVDSMQSAHCKEGLEGIHQTSDNGEDAEVEAKKRVCIGRRKSVHGTGQRMKSGNGQRMKSTTDTVASSQNESLRKIAGKRQKMAVASQFTQNSIAGPPRDRASAEPMLMSNSVSASQSTRKPKQLVNKHAAIKLPADFFSDL